MNFKDKWEIDEETGERFLFTVEMQRRLEKAGLPINPAYLSQVSQEEALKPPPSHTPAPKSAPKVESRELAGPLTIQIDPQTGKYIGQVKWYNTKKGFGFILRGEGEEIFFHKSSSAADLPDLQDGQWVLYDVEDTKKGPEATDVELYDGLIPE